MKSSNLWAVIPARNEEKDIFKVVQKTGNYAKKIVLVDDGSTDKTALLGGKAGAIVLRHVVNLGKGAALKTGCDYAAKNGAKFIIVLDADTQHNPKDIPRFADKLKKYDIVFSYRKLSRKMPFVLRIGNLFISMTVKLLYGIDLKDTQCGFRAFSRGAYKKIRWVAADYSMESEMIARAGRQRLKYVQIPIQTIYSDKYKGTTIVDGMKIVLSMFWWRLLNGNNNRG